MIIVRVAKEIKNVIFFRKGLSIVVIENTPLRGYLCGSSERERLEFLPFFPGSENEIEADSYREHSQL